MKITLRTKLCFALLSFALFINMRTGYAQDSKPVRVAVLAPLYLDSAFNGYTYKLGVNNLPKYILPGLDFYNGVMMAVDSLEKEKTKLEVWIYDTKKAGQDIHAMLKGFEYMNFSLVIASITNATEQQALSQFSFNKSIPVISATYPNDATLSGNPFFAMVNPTLKTHVEGIYKYAQKNYATAKVLYLTKTGALEDKIKAQFTAMDTTPNRLRYKIATLAENFTPEQLLPMLDSTKQNVIVCGTLSESFGTTLAKTMNSNGSYRTTIIGMPTWDGSKLLSATDITKPELVYSTPFNYTRNDKLSANIIKNYRTKFNGRPSDMVFKGFETVYHFTKLYLQHTNDFINHLSDNDFTLVNDYEFLPVQLSPQSFVPDYLENKKLYFIKKQAGVVKSVY